jgi:ATP-dependent exoDNAse (exonuclease V) alpha subunit
MTQDKAFEILKSGKNVFLTGDAGSGKTFLLNKFIKHLVDEDVTVAVTASTGIAATHLSGQTIHSWSGMGIKDRVDAILLDKIKCRNELVENIKKTDVLIIDEISMLHKKQFNCVDAIMRVIRKDERPFGGLQIVVTGDFFQLPPVGKDYEKSSDKFCFMSDAWVDAKFQVCYLTEQHRNKCGRLNTILNGIRTRKLDTEQYELLDSRVEDSIPDNDCCKLFTHNMNVDRFNEQKLNELQGKLKSFHCEVEGLPNFITTLSKSVLAPEILKLKKNALVMFVKNDPMGEYFNGTMGTVTGFTKDGNPLVRTKEGNKVFVTRASWEMKGKGDEILAKFVQYPLRLAWAITVHKSQGMTLDSAHIDLSRAFDYGQGYVALSRLKDINGLTLSGYSDFSLQLDPLAIKADERFQELSSEIA